MHKLKNYGKSLIDIKAGLHSVTIERINIMPQSTSVKHYIHLSAEHIKVDAKNTSKLPKIGMALTRIYLNPEWGYKTPKWHQDYMFLKLFHKYI